MLKLVKCYNLQKHSTASRNYTMTYCQTLQEVTWPKLEKIAKIGEIYDIKKLKTILWPI